MNPFNSNFPPLNPPQTSNPANKRPLEEESEQETKRQKLEKGMARVYNNAVDEMAINEKEPRIQELEKVETVEANPINSSSSHEILDAMDIDGDASAVQPNIALVQSKTEKVSRPNFDEMKKNAAEKRQLIARQDDEERTLSDRRNDEKRQLSERYHAAERELEERYHAEKKHLTGRHNAEQLNMQMKHVEDGKKNGKEFLVNLIQEKSENLSQEIDWLIECDQLEVILKEVIWTSFNNDEINHFLTHFFSSKQIQAMREKGNGYTYITKYHESVEMIINRPLKVSLLLWNTLSEYWMTNRQNIRLNFSDTMIYMIPKAGPRLSVNGPNYYEVKRIAETYKLRNFYIPKELLNFASQLLAQGLKIPTVRKSDEIQKYLTNQVLKFLNYSNFFPESNSDRWQVQMALVLKGDIDLAYATDGAIPITQDDDWIKIDSFPQKFWDKWIAVKIELGNSVAYVLLTKNDCKKYLPDLDGWIDYDVTKILQFSPLNEYDFSDYVRFFKGMNSQDVSTYTLEETVKLFNISIFHNQTKIIPACEKRLIELVNVDNVGEIADKLPMDLKDVAPSLHTKMKSLLWNTVYSGGWKMDALSALSPNQKNLMDSFALSEPWAQLPPNTFQTLAEHFSSHIKKLTLNTLPKKLLNVLKEFKSLKELELERLEYTEEMAKTLQQLTGLNTLSFKTVNLSSNQNQPSIKKLRLKSDNIQDLDKLFSVFNSLTYLEIPSVKKTGTRSVFTKFIGNLKELQTLNVSYDSPRNISTYSGGDETIMFDVEDLLNLKILDSDVTPTLPRVDIQLLLLEELSIRNWNREDTFLKSCPNLKKAKFTSSRRRIYSLGYLLPEVAFDLKHLSKLEDFHIHAYTIKREVLEDLSKLFNLTHIKIDANVLLEDKPNPIDDLIRLPKLKSFACRSELMTQAVYEYAMNNGITVEIL